MSQRHRLATTTPGPGARRLGERALGGFTAAAGLALLLAPGRVGAFVAGSGPLPARPIVRALGGRQLVQGTAQLVAPRRELVLGGVVVDALHLSSMLVLALVWPAYRRPALYSAAVATLTAGSGAALLTGDRQ